MSRPPGPRVVHRLLRLSRGGGARGRERGRPPCASARSIRRRRAAARGPRPAFYRRCCAAASASPRRTWTACGRAPTSSPSCASARATARRSTARGAGCARSSAPRALGRARNTIHRSRRQIAAHYDLGNDLFALFLDERMMYSSASSPPRARRSRTRRCTSSTRVRQARLGPATTCSRSAPAGAGWPSTPPRYGCRVTTTTSHASSTTTRRARVRAAGVEDRVTVLLRDYRELEGSYDKLVSIEMIEAVGWKDFGTFFACCSDLLAPNGLMLLQAITIDDRAYHVERATAASSPPTSSPAAACPPARSSPAAWRGAPTARGRAAGHHRRLRRDAAPLARLPRAWTRSPRWATTSASGGCGTCTSPIARRDSASAASATYSSCWPNRAGAADIPAPAAVEAPARPASVAAAG